MSSKLLIMKNGFITSEKALSPAYAISLSTLMLLAGWIFLDPGFHFIFTAGLHLVFQRLLPFVVLVVLAVLSTAFVSIRLLFGSVRGRSLKGHVLALVLLSTWFGLWRSYDQIAWAGVMWRVQHVLPGLKVDAQVLVKNWPTESGTLPNLGDFTLEEWGWDRRLVLKKWEREPLPRIVVGRTIERDQGRWIVFSLDVMCQIVYQPRNGFASDPAVPEGKNDAWSPNRRIIQIEPEWFLVASASEFPFPPESVSTCKWSRETQRFSSEQEEN